MKKLIIPLVLLAILASCGSGKSDYASDLYLADEMVPLARADFDAPPPPPPPAEVSSDLRVDEKFSEQVLVKTVRLSIEVNDYELARTKIDSIVKIYKAWISSENMYNYDYRISNDFSIRVPSNSLDQVLTGFISISKKVDYQNLETSDVTEEYIDVDSRLKTQKELERRFIGLLRRTDSIEEILKIETKLAEVRGQIESFEGRLKYLKSRVNYSTVYLSVYQRIDYKFVPEPSKGFWERFKSSINRGWKGFVVFILFLIRLWPIWILGGLLTFIIYLIDKRRRNRGKLGKKKLKKGKVKVKEKRAQKGNIDSSSEQASI